MISIFLSSKTKTLDLARTSALVCCSMKIPANVTPMQSAVLCKSTNKYTVEEAARIDILRETIERDDILVLFRRLQDTLGIHCVWLDYFSEYHGCLLAWPHYLNGGWDKIGHDKPMQCSEYINDLPLSVSFGTVFDHDRWDAFLEAVESSLTFVVSTTYYLHEHRFLCEVGKDNNIAEITSVTKFYHYLDSR